MDGIRTFEFHFAFSIFERRGLLICEKKNKYSAYRQIGSTQNLLRKMKCWHEHDEKEKLFIRNASRAQHD